MSNCISLRAARNTHFKSCGKTREILKVIGTDTLDDAIDTATRSTGTTKSETVRSLLEAAMFGHLWVAQSSSNATRRSPLTRQEVDLDDAVSALALMRGMSRDEYVECVLREHVFGLLHVPQSGLGDAGHKDCVEG